MKQTVHERRVTCKGPKPKRKPRPSIPKPPPKGDNKGWKIEFAKPLSNEEVKKLAEKTREMLVPYRLWFNAIKDWEKGGMN